MTQELVYEDVDENGEVPVAAKNKLMKDALEAKTPLQTKLFASSKATRFADTGERRRWAALERNATASPDGRVWLAWLTHCIGWVTKQNSPIKRMPYSAAIAYAENEQKRENWTIKNRESVLQRKDTAAVQTDINKRLDDLHNQEGL